MSSDRSSPTPRILALNGGSSSVKFALYEARSLELLLSGRLEGVGQSGAALVVERSGGAVPEGRSPIDAPDHARAAERLAGWLAERSLLAGLAAVGHRIVHGGPDLLAHQAITPGVLRTLKENRALDPAHLPQGIAMIEALRRMAPRALQVACFDTAFHRDLPRVARLLPIPRAHIDAGIRRLGFHGLSYEYLVTELRRLGGDQIADGRLVLAHLGSGASLAAVRGGKPVDTSMAFTPSAGLVMGTRPGDLDPGLLLHLMRLERRTARTMDAFVNEKCGLLGVSGTTSDMRTLLERRGEDERAADAVALFGYQAAKWIGAFTVALGGLDTLVFTGGIGERSAEIRGEICEWLEFLKVRVDEASNSAHAAVISADGSAVSVRVIPTDEQIVIARAARAILEET